MKGPWSNIGSIHVFHALTFAGSRGSCCSNIFRDTRQMLTPKRPSAVIYNPIHTFFIFLIFLQWSCQFTCPRTIHSFFLQGSTHWCGEDNGNLCGVINQPTIFYIGMIAAKMVPVFEKNICISRQIGPGPAKMCLMAYASNKGSDQPAHLRSLISTFVARCWDSMICILALSRVSIF